MRRLPLAATLAIAALATGAAGCGDSENLIEEGSLRDCLAGDQLKLEPADLSAGAVLGNVSPDFRLVTAEGDRVEVVVVGNEQKADRVAADARGSLQALGAPDSEVITDRNAVIVIEGEPSPQLRAIVEDCLEG